MEPPTRCFGIFRLKEKPRRTASRKKEHAPNVRESPMTVTNEDAPSTATKQKVAAAKQYIEKHYKEQMRSLEERKERRNMLERKLAAAEVTEEEQNNILKYLEKKETEYMRIQRHKMGADDFEPLTMIGKGAFGESDSQGATSTKSGPWRKMLSSKDVNFMGYTYKNFEIVNEHEVPGIAELKKKTTKPKRPTVKSLFMDEESNSAPVQPAQGSFMNLLPPK